MNDTLRPAWREVAELQKCSLAELREEYLKCFGKPTKSRNRKQLVDQLAERLQAVTPASSVLAATFYPRRKLVARREKATKPARTRASLAVGARDSRLPKVGTTLTKVYKGRTINVRVKEKGFAYAGADFRSLSAVARKVTGQTWNGFLFFGLVKPSRKTA